MLPRSTTVAYPSTIGHIRLAQDHNTVVSGETSSNTLPVQDLSNRTPLTQMIFYSLHHSGPGTHHPASESFHSTLIPSTQQYTIKLTQQQFYGGTWFPFDLPGHAQLGPTTYNFNASTTSFPPCDWNHNRFWVAPTSSTTPSPFHQWPLGLTMSTAYPLLLGKSTWSQRLSSSTSTIPLLGTHTFFLMCHLTNILCDDSPLIAVSDRGCILDLQLGSCGW